ncbi:hypothetical protein LWI28_011931 [Acer negundo]|uniref:Uncharacterized protein n=1 Tax=Acer negundo TaxID=4023 RepID=A0AAD5NZH9_ACENE|nr:hypothetical protein LWI28_011931 [Acer negundo]
MVKKLRGKPPRPLVSNAKLILEKQMGDCEGLEYDSEDCWSSSNEDSEEGHVLNFAKFKGESSWVGPNQLNGKLVVDPGFVKEEQYGPNGIGPVLSVNDPFGIIESDQEGLDKAQSRGFSEEGQCARELGFCNKGQLEEVSRLFTSEETGPPLVMSLEDDLSRDDIVGGGLMVWWARRWTLIAGRLPGRTDNEIKNYWKTNLSKKLKGDDKNTSTQLHKSKKKINGCSRISSMLSNSQESKPAEPHQVFLTKAVRCTKVIIPGLLDYSQTVDHNVGAENIVSQSSSAPVPQEGNNNNSTTSDDDMLMDLTLANSYYGML